MYGNIFYSHHHFWMWFHFFKFIPSYRLWLDPEIIFSTAADVPDAEVGSRGLECLTSNPHAVDTAESAHFMSVLTHQYQVILEPPSSDARNRNDRILYFKNLKD